MKTEISGRDKRAWYTLFKRALNLNVNYVKYMDVMLEVARIVAGCNDVPRILFTTLWLLALTILGLKLPTCL